MKQPYPESPDKMSIDLKAHGLRLKPLEWRGSLSFIFGGCYSIGKSGDGRYEIYENSGTRRLSMPTDCYTIDEAKAACQAHHEAQVISQLESIEGGQ